MDLILAIITGVLAFILILLGKRIKIGFFQRLHSRELQMGSKLMAAFLVGFIVFTILTDKIANPGQKIPLIIVSLLLIWANLFLQVGQDATPGAENQDPRHSPKNGA